MAYQDRPQYREGQQGKGTLDDLVTLCAYCHMVEHGQLSYTIPAVRVCSKPNP
jgi:predicted HNH restriction endonuclease